LSNLGALILAAGQSRRFGSDKREAQLPSGESVITATVRQARNHFDSVCVVLRSSDQAVAEMLTQLGPDINVTHAPMAHLGMGHSLAHGIDQVRDWSGAAICLADMPFHRAETLSALTRQFGQTSLPSPIIIPMHEGQSGHPVIFHRNHFAALSKLEGDQGARRVIEGNAEHLIKIELDDPGIVQDIDQPEDL